MNREPEVLLENGGDMVIFLRLCDKFSNSVLDGLQFANVTIQTSAQDAVAIV